MTDDLQRLVALMDKCQRDTLSALGGRAAQRLANWQRHEGDLRALVRFVHERLMNTPESGYALEMRSLLSLERIVAHEMPHLFSTEDIQVAKFTLRGIF